MGQEGGRLEVELEGVVDVQEGEDEGVVVEEESDVVLDAEEDVAGGSLDGEVDDLVALVLVAALEVARLAGDGEDDAAGAAGLVEEVLLPEPETGAGVRPFADDLLEEGKGAEDAGDLEDGGLHDVGAGAEEVGEVDVLADLALAPGVFLEGVDGAEVEAVLVDEEGVAEDADGAVGVEVGLGLGVFGEEGLVAGEEGGHSEFDLGEVDGGDNAAVPAGSDATADLGRVGLVGALLAGDATLLGAAGLAAVLELGRDDEPGGVGEVDVRVAGPRQGVLRRRGRGR